ncbi:hypothetical protein [Duganella sp. BJB1802]|uniref:hypothetical protein n=1 Tax=Duganella sp. BJB1802 TaxID=2744575 RepID=UPI001E5F10FC|nr:hypothetical protein [Duganella sp. BJB1802]
MRLTLPLRADGGMMPVPISVAIVDDEPLARLALKARLEAQPGFELVAEYGDGDTPRFRGWPRCVLTSSSWMPKRQAEAGLAARAALRTAGPW